MILKWNILGGIIILVLIFNISALKDNSIYDNLGSTLTITQGDNKVLVYRIDPVPGISSIGNGITELYAPNSTDNLVDNTSPIAPPQIVIKVKDKDTNISDDCKNNICKSEPCTCDYFAHHDTKLDVLTGIGDAIKFRVKANSSQHDNNATPINYSTDMVITVKRDKNYTIIEYDVVTILNQKLKIDQAIRPLPIFEVVNNRYEHISYLNSSCQVNTTDIPTNIYNDTEKIFIKGERICRNESTGNSIAWAALYSNTTANLGMILQLWNSTIGEPRFYAYVEKINDSNKNITNTTMRPNMYFQDNRSNISLENEKWTGKIIFLVYSEDGYEPVKRFADKLADNI